MAAQNGNGTIAATVDRQGFFDERDRLVALIEKLQARLDDRAVTASDLSAAAVEIATATAALAVINRRIGHFTFEDLSATISAAEADRAAALERMKAAEPFAIKFKQEWQPLNFDLEHGRQMSGQAIARAIKLYQENLVGAMQFAAARLDLSIAEQTIGETRREKNTIDPAYVRPMVLQV